MKIYSFIPYFAHLIFKTIWKVACLLFISGYLIPNGWLKFDFFFFCFYVFLCYILLVYLWVTLVAWMNDKKYSCYYVDNSLLKNKCARVTSGGTASYITNTESGPSTRLSFAIFGIVIIIFYIF